MPSESTACQVMNGRPNACTRAATLIVFAAGDCDCRPCVYREGKCQGHPVCDEHCAALRMAKLPIYPRLDDSPPFVVGRARTLAQEAS